ncbi:putative Protein kinase domain [Monocercomonoides exilis]|uniref:putative Protein kinase domain n=1 Tax=Monocercomonoides exilis TaxID=2049356 RepID=UPI00355A542F|nr:putative Protein kinase domain [Monocercomonoides exilis]
MKTDNVLLHDPSGTFKASSMIAKITDFGLSRSKKMTFAATMTQCGTPLNAAPELLSREHRYDEKIDIWALGMIMYQMLTGRHPVRPGSFSTYAGMCVHDKW